MSTARARAQARQSGLHYALKISVPTDGEGGGGREEGRKKEGRTRSGGRDGFTVETLLSK